MGKTYGANAVTKAIKDTYGRLYTGAEIKRLVSVVFRADPSKTSSEIEAALTRQIPAKNAAAIIGNLVK